MIIWGSKGRTRTIATGNFNCPHCGAPRQYKHIKIQRWFTLYFVPLFPTSTLGEHVECNSCGNTFSMNVLNYDPATEEAKRKTLVADLWRTAMISLACVFKPANENQAQIIRDGFVHNWDKPTTVEEILQDSYGAPAGGVAEESILSRVANLQQHLSLAESEIFLNLAWDVLTAGSGSTEQIHDLLQKAGKQFKMSDAHLRGILLG